MPYKDQLYSYRTRNGVRYISYRDIAAEEAKAELAKVRLTSPGAFRENIGGGMCRIFVRDLTAKP